jgi:hypothetical protein
MSHLAHGLLLFSALAAAGCDTRTPAPPPPLATGQRNVTALKTDGDHVYWSRGDGSIQRVAASGGAVEELAKGLPVPDHIALDSGSVYFSASGQIGRTAKTGSAPEMLIQTGAAGLDDLQVDATQAGQIYWIPSADQGQGQVLAAAKVIGAAGAIINEQGASVGKALALTGPDLYYPAVYSGPTSQTTSDPATVIRVTTSADVYTDTMPGVFYGLTTFGSTICGSGPDAQALALDPTSTAQAVTCAALDGSDVHVVVSGISSNVEALAVDGSSVYFASFDGSVSAASLDGGTIVPTQDIITSSDDTTTPPSPAPGAPVVFAVGPQGGASLAVDGSSVYWAYANGDAVLSMPAF